MLTILQADLQQVQHADDLVLMLNTYASDPMGGGEPLSDFVRQNLIAELQKRPNIRGFLAYQNDQAVGFAICIEGFSTFACKPLLNIHDFGVHPDFRGWGIAKKLLGFISDFAQTHAYCKITLEVLQGNAPAHALYIDQGFSSYELNPAMGGAIMMQKKFA
ncbi:GNAT family N-acetyltransferase [Undibacterium jejuense]|uniref:GNAT family N-acetyltransferase n=1 Tax=Undibacterium jejuense TaxID=1344949 RepID=A0A923HKU0_9BURK|nr:GNAT family N-acetyltransferase [Undibacterium jejuense]MBC3861486.1 GNAT family N-acetyltransferase [Undibacterium jejuense]